MEDLKRQVISLDQKLDKTGEDIAEIKIILTGQAADLKYHISRTDQIEDKLIPIVELKLKLDGAFKLIGMAGSGLGLVFAAIKAIEFLMKLI